MFGDKKSLKSFNIKKRRPKIRKGMADTVPYILQKKMETMTTSNAKSIEQLKLVFFVFSY